uniref:Aminopeptidase N3a n=2 Tax=Plutella xylostella TaxID=51655 RepID=A0A6G5NKS8_PLUXY|nr:aminopeptidase N3a [Plutella xylostella]
MATTTTRILIALVGLGAAFALPPVIKIQRNTIFTDEMLEGQVFENVDAFSNEEIALFQTSQNEYRLPTTTKPINYKILWSFDFKDDDNLSFAGNVDIQLVATQENVNEIVIHCGKDLNIATVGLKKGNEVVTVQNYEKVELYEFLKIQPAESLVFTPASDTVYTLSISFNGAMRNDMYGIYKSWFKTGTETKWMASTQFQGTSARFAFPCYDEPSFKATFDITLRRPTEYRSWSNTKLKSSDPTVNIENYVDDVFATTPVMSTYLIAIIVAEYKSLEDNNNPQQLKYEVIARPDAIDNGQGQYAYDVGQKLLAEMSDHTGLDFYEVDANLKMTQAAIPDFSAGAMENWGLLTYREAYLMYDEKQTNYNSKQLIAYILSHEIAHMWFGNLVTCDWWDVLWLNEGFARYYQYFLTNAVETEMGFETRFITEQVHTALLADAANNPHPLTNPGVGSPAQVSGMFSTLSYNKGASLIRMTEHLLGYNVHREGLRKYISDFKFKTALPINLFESLEAAAKEAGALAEYGPNFSLVEYYKSWTEQGSAPVLFVEVNHQTGDMTVTQQRFNINTGMSTSNSLWIVPVSFATASKPDFSNTKPTHILSATANVIPRGSQGDEWVIFNIQQTGYYRVNYDSYTWDLIIRALRGEDRIKIHPYNRAQIVNDVFSYARSGIMTYQRAMTILSFLEFETEYAPWVAAITGFNWLTNRLSGPENAAVLDKLTAEITRWGSRAMATVGYTASNANEAFMTTYLRYQLAPFMCRLGVEECLQSADRQFAALKVIAPAQPVEVDVNNRNWVYCNALRRGDASDFEFLWQRFLDHPVYTEKILLLGTLGCTKDEESLKKFMSAIVTDNLVIRPQDYTTAWNSAVTGNEENTQIAFQFVQGNLNTVAAAFPRDGIATPLSYISSRLRTAAEIDAFQSWAKANENTLNGFRPGSYASINAGAESTRQALEWAAEISPTIQDFLDTPVELPQLSTPDPPPEVDTETTPQPDLPEPEVPDLPDSAATSFLSVFAITVAVIANILV